jgi:hypothetical protein
MEWLTVSRDAFTLGSHFHSFCRRSIQHSWTAHRLSDHKLTRTQTYSKVCLNSWIVLTKPFSMSRSLFEFEVSIWTHPSPSAPHCIESQNVKQSHCLSWSNLFRDHFCEQVVKVEWRWNQRHYSHNSSPESDCRHDGHGYTFDKFGENPVKFEWSLNPTIKIQAVGEGSLLMTARSSSPHSAVPPHSKFFFAMEGDIPSQDRDWQLRVGTTVCHCRALEEAGWLRMAHDEHSAVAGDHS